MYSQVLQAFEDLNAALDEVESAPTAELRQVLGLAKPMRSRFDLLEAKAASQVAQRESHGDGGAGLLNQVGGLSRSDAARKVRTDEGLTQLPAAQSGVAAGEISFANADKLLQAARKTGHDAVQNSVELVQMAKTLPEDEFARAAQRWTIRQLSAEDLAAQHRRHKQHRHVRFWAGDDGSVQMRGSFDTEMGARIQQRLRHEAELLRQTDRRLQQHTQPGTTSSDIAQRDAVRTRDQRMADALDGLLRNTHSLDTDASQSTDESTGNNGRVDSDRRDNPSTDSRRTQSRRTDSHRADSRPISSRRSEAEIVVRADLDALVGKQGGLAEIAGSGPIPPQVLQRLACNSDLSLVIFGDGLIPLYETTASRAPTAAQRRALIARDGACIGCGAPPTQCEAHHIVPWSCGGKTRVDNLTLVCWSCHDRIHDNNWQVVTQDGQYKLVTGNGARRTNLAPSRKPPRQTSPPSPLPLLSGEP